MHVPVFCLAETSRPMTKREIEAKLHDPSDICLGEYLDYVSDYKGGIRPGAITEIYDGRIFELVQEDKEEGIHHVYRLKEGAKEYVAEVKFAALKDEFDKLTPENVLKDYWKLQSAVINPLHYFCVCNLDMAAAFDEYPKAYPFNEWFIKCAEKGTMYQIVQIFDAHI